MPSAKPVKKGTPKGKKKGGRSSANVEDLDLDVNKFFREDEENDAALHDDDLSDEEEQIVQDKRRFRKQDMLEVLPSEAHKLDDLAGAGKRGYEPGERHEEEEIAVETAKKGRSRLDEDDFDLGLVNKAAAKNAKLKKAKAAAGGAGGFDDNSAVIEKVERDFSAISSEEKLKLLQKESPEVLKLVEDFNTSMEQVKTISSSLHQLLHGKKAPADQQHLVSFLETKVQLMLSYCMHITFYLLLKMEGKKVNNHPVVDKLVEIRVYLEKLWPMEQKLQYSLKELLAKGVKAGAAAAGNRARVGEMRPVEESTTKSLQKAASANAAKVEMRKNLKKIRDAEALEKAELAQMSRGAARKKQALTMGIDEVEGGIGDGYHEKEDQYFSSLMPDEDEFDEEDGDFDGEDEDLLGMSDEDEEGGALIDKLRARVGKKSKTHHGESTKARDDAEFDDEEDYEEDFDDEDDMLGAGGDDEDDFMYGDDEGDDEEGDLFDELAAEQAEEDELHGTSKYDDVDSKPKKSVLEAEIGGKGRRQINKKIETHRGLTKIRPKDRKNPRTAQRRKFERGEQKAKAQTRSFKEAPEDYHGVANFKPHVTHSTKY